MRKDGLALCMLKHESRLDKDKETIKNLEFKKGENKILLLHQVIAQRC